MKEPQRILFIDGVCNLCNGFVQFLLKRDSKGKLYYAHLQGSDAFFENLRIELDNKMGSVVFFDQGEVYTHSDAALHAIDQLGGVYKLVSIFRILPKGFRNAIYNFIAKNRYKWFGRKNQCIVPVAELEDRFLTGEIKVPTD